MEVSRYNVVCIKRNDPSVTVSFTSASGFTVVGNIITVEVETGAIYPFNSSNWTYIMTEYKIKVPNET